MNECTCGGKRAKVGDPISLTKYHGQSHLQNPKLYHVTHLARSITRPQYHRKFMAFHKNNQSRKNNINSSAELFQEIQKIWIDITPQNVQSLYSSIPTRIMQAIRLKGHLSKY